MSRHCRHCIHFTPSRIWKCTEGYWTGLGTYNPTANEQYPDSYAAYPCRKYKNSERFIYKGENIKGYTDEQRTL